MEKSIDKVKATIVLNNIKEHNFTIADYKLCEDEAKICIQLLSAYIGKNEVEHETVDGDN